MFPVPIFPRYDATIMWKYVGNAYLTSTSVPFTPKEVRSFVDPKDSLAHVYESCFRKMRIHFGKDHTTG